MNDDLLPVTVSEMMTEVQREIDLRLWVYAGLVERKKLRQSKADRQLAVMRAVLEFLRGHAD